MFDNIGRKIKTYAIINSVISIIISLIVAIVLIVIGADYENGALIAVGIAVGIWGMLNSWIGSFILIGYGQLVQNSDKANELLKLITIENI